MIPGRPRGTNTPRPSSWSGEQKNGNRRASQVFFQSHGEGYRHKALIVNFLRNIDREDFGRARLSLRITPVFPAEAGAGSGFWGVRHLHKLFTGGLPSGAASGARIEIEPRFAQEKMAKSSQLNFGIRVKFS